MKTFKKKVSGVYWDGSVQKLKKDFRQYKYFIICCAGSFQIASYVESDEPSAIKSFLMAANKEIGIEL